MSADDVIATAARGTEERAPRARLNGAALLSDVVWRVIVAQGLIEDGNVGEALGVLYDLEDDLAVIREGVVS